MKDAVIISMILSVMLGFIGVGRLCWDTKYAVILLFLYAMGAILILSMVFILNTGNQGTTGKGKSKLQLRPNSNEYIIRGGYVGKTPPSFTHYT